jgi:hypothetical protein
MRFAVASVVLALGSSAYAAALAPRLLNCICPVDKTGDKDGALIYQKDLTYKCAYTHGACFYDTVRDLSFP